MEDNKSNYGSSLLVPSVQELAKDPSLTVPSRYIRHDQDQSLTSENDHALHFSHQIPVIDFQKLLSEKSTGSGSDSEFEKLHLACKDWGFFQVHTFIVLRHDQLIIYRKYVRIISSS